MITVTEIELLDVEIKLLERTIEVLYRYYEELECSGSATYTVAECMSDLVNAKRIYRSSLIARLELDSQ